MADFNVGQQPLHLNEPVAIQVRAAPRLLGARASESLQWMRERVSSGIERLCAELGLLAQVEVDVNPDQACSGLAVDLRGRDLEWPGRMARELALISPDSGLRTALASTVSDDEPLALLGAYVAELAIDADWRAVYEYLADLAVEAVRREPGVLIGSAPEGVPEQVTSLLQQLLDLGVSVADRTWLPAVNERIPEPDFSPLRALEWAFATLRSDTVQVQLHPLYRTELAEQLGAAFDAVLSQAEARLYDEWGLEAPDLVWSATPRIPSGLVGIKVNDLAGLPLPGPRAEAAMDGAVSLVDVVLAQLVAHSPRLLSMEEIEDRLNHLRYEAPGIVEALLARFSVETVSRHCRDLLQAGIPLTFLRGIAEALIDYDEVSVARAEGSLVYTADDQLAIDPIASHDAGSAAPDYVAFTRRRIHVRR